MKCSLDVCDKEAGYRGRKLDGMCYGHHQKLKKYGDPLAGGSIGRSRKDKAGKRECVSCREKFPATIGFFYEERDWLSSSCRSCISVQRAKWKIDNPEKVKRYRRKQVLSPYGLSIEQYDEMLKNQEGVCFICRNTNKGKALAVDHVHGTQIVRGLLCDACNLAIGLLRDDLNNVERAFEYLKISDVNNE